MTPIHQNNLGIHHKGQNLNNITLGMDNCGSANKYFTKQISFSIN